MRNWSVYTIDEEAVGKENLPVTGDMTEREMVSTVDSLITSMIQFRNKSLPTINVSDFDGEDLEISLEARSRQFNDIEDMPQAIDLLKSEISERKVEVSKERENAPSPEPKIN